MRLKLSTYEDVSQDAFECLVFMAFFFSFLCSCASVLPESPGLMSDRYVTLFAVNGVGWHFTQSGLNF